MTIGILPVKKYLHRDRAAEPSFLLKKVVRVTGGRRVKPTWNRLQCRVSPRKPSRSESLGRRLFFPVIGTHQTYGGPTPLQQEFDFLRRSDSLDGVKHHWNSSGSSVNPENTSALAFNEGYQSFHPDINVP
ncbi:uncharacterized protein [Hetaerina americana]|uniref:uncharacterized protein n=1 Tax=Hetaerina americana TaxID=62018 RepID=UPI003A7F3B66